MTFCKIFSSSFDGALFSSTIHLLCVARVLWFSSCLDLGFLLCHIFFCFFSSVVMAPYDLFVIKYSPLRSFLFFVLVTFYCSFFSVVYNFCTRLLILFYGDLFGFPSRFNNSKCHFSRLPKKVRSISLLWWFLEIKVGFFLLTNCSVTGRFFQYRY